MNSIPRTRRYPVLIFMAACVVGVFAAVDHYTGLLLTQDKKFFSFDVTQALVQTYRNQVELNLRSRLWQLEKLSSQVLQGDASHAFSTLSYPLSDELLGVDIFELDAKGNAHHVKTVPNLAQIKEKKLSPHLLEDLNKHAPLDTSSWKHARRLRLSKRVLREGDHTHAFISMIVPAKTAATSGHRFVLVADLTPEFLTEALRPTENAELFLLNGDGSLLAHPDLTWMQEETSSFSHPATEHLADAHEAGENFEWKWDGRSYYATMAPLGLGEATVVSQLHKQEALLVTKKMRTKLAALGSILLCVFGLWILVRGGRWDRSLYAIAQTADAFSRWEFQNTSYLKKAPALKGIVRRLEGLGQALHQRWGGVVHEATGEVEQKLTQTIHAFLGNLPNSRFPGLDFQSHRSTRPSTYLDFWDVYQEGNQIQVVLGRTLASGTVSALFLAMAKSALETARSMSSEKNKSLSVLLGVVNQALYRAFHGRLVLELSALEIDLLSSEVKVINAGHAAPLRISRNGSPVVTADGRALAMQQAPLGQNADMKYLASPIEWKGGEIILISTDLGHLEGTPEGKISSADLIRQALQKNNGKTLAQLKEDLMATSRKFQVTTWFIIEKSETIAVRAA